jgi:serine/threonine protein kinase
MSLIHQLLDAVEASHMQSVIHRDLKPENILLSDDNQSLVLADFGIAHFAAELLAATVETQDSERLANFRYAAPEQRVPSGRVDHRSDIYALGLIINELFTGQVPQGTEYAQIGDRRPSLSQLDVLVRSMIQQDPQNRPESIERIKARMEVLLDERITRQRLSRMRDSVVADIELSDPIIADPVHVVRRDWEDGQLKLYLSQEVNPKWIWAFQNMGGHTSVMGHGPETFTFNRNVASTSVGSGSAKRLTDFFDRWLPRVHQVYVQKVKRDEQQRIEQQQRAARTNIEKEQERLRVLRDLNP